MSGVQMKDALSKHPVLSCANCCAPVKKTSPKCGKCKAVIQAVYCSKKCMSADAARHKDECRAAVDFDNMPDLLKPFLEVTGPDDTTAAYRCVAEEGGPGFEALRKLPTHKRSAPEDLSEDCNPLITYKRRFVAGSNAVCKPWTSFASATSLMVTWLPPTATTRFAVLTYAMEQRECSEPGSKDEPGPWHVPEEAHSGTTPSLWVQGLTTGKWMQFRAKATGPAPWDAQGTWSEASDPFRVGYADFSCVPAPPEGLPPSDFSDAEKKFFKTLDTPAKVQDFLDTIPMNHEVQDETLFSALETLRQNHGHCIEGAMLGAYILSLNGHPPLMMDMVAHDDDSHNIIPFRVKGKWGALSVSNHASLRYRNPLYATIRELMMSYLDDYMNGQGQRSLVGYTMPMNMEVVFGPRWASRRGNVWAVGMYGDCQKQYDILDAEELKDLRQADDMMHASTVLQREWRCPDNFDEETARRNDNK